MQQRKPSAKGKDKPSTKGKDKPSTKGEVDIRG